MNLDTPLYPINMPRTRVIHIISSLNTGGAQRALYNLLTSGLHSEHESAVVSLRGPGWFGDHLRAAGIPVYTLGIGGLLPGIGAATRLRRIVREFGPDICQGWMYHGNLAASMAAWLSPGNTAVAWNIRHSLYEIDSEKALTRQVVRVNSRFSSLPDRLVYNSRVSREQHERFGFDWRSARVIPNGFDLDGLGPDREMADRVRAEFGIPRDALVVGHVARLHPMKDHASFLRACVRVAERIPDARFLVVGRDVDPARPELRGIVPPALLDRFAFPGERRDATNLMRAMDMLCMTSAWGEAFPNVIGEAMACGIPCVTTDVGDSADVIADTGRVVPRSDHAALAQGVIDMLSMSAEVRTRMGTAARERVRAHFALESVVRDYSAMYGELVARHERNRP